MKTIIIKTYSELISYKTFEERLEYLRTNQRVGELTFAGHRYANQKFYSSYEWKNFRKRIIVRDNGCDLGIEDQPIHGMILVHHINPISIEDIVEGRKCVIDPENAISVSFVTHEAIHYGKEINRLPSERKQFDTCPWKGV